MPPEQTPPADNAIQPNEDRLVFDDEFNKRFNDALQKDGKADTAIPKENQNKTEPPVQAPQEKPQAKAAPEVSTPKPQAAAPAVKPETVKPPVSQDDDAPPATIKGTKAAEDWKRLKQEHRAREAELTQKILDFETEIKKLKSEPRTPDNQEEIQALKREHEIMSEQLRILDVEKHPRFQAYFSEKINNALNLAKQSVGGELSEKVVSVLQLPEGDYKKEQLRTLFTELDEFQQEDVKDANRQIRAAQFERQQEIAKAKENYAKVQRDQQEQETKFKDSFVTALKATLKEASDPEKGLPVFQEKDGDDEWNNYVRARKSNAEQFVNATINGKITPKELALTATWAMAAEPILKNSIALANENAQLRAKLQEYEASVPNPSEGDAQPPAHPKEESTGEYVKDVFARAQRELSGRF